MKTIKIKLNKITGKQIDLIVNYFKRGKTIAYLTDTIYGLGCLATNKKAINKIHKIKQLPKSKPLLVLANSLAMVEKYCEVSSRQKKFLRQIWPGPVTTILISKRKLPEELTGGKNTLAVRLPINSFLTKLIKKVGAPIVSTSLNIADRTPLNSVSNLDNYFKRAKPDLIIDAGVAKKAKASRLIDITDVNNIKVIRK